MWKDNGDYLEKSFEFKDFRAAFAFMTRVAFVAEEFQHHPDWSNSFNKLTIKLTSHDAGGKVTEKDRKMAESIDQLID